MTRVLIADDHEIVRHGLRDILTSRLDSVTVGEACDAGGAIRMFLEQSWDLVLLDINMPGRSGLEVLEEVRRLHSETPVLVLTTYPEEQFKAGCGRIHHKERSHRAARHSREASVARRQIRHRIPRRKTCLRFGQPG